jgi:hypothetical protein
LGQLSAEAGCIETFSPNRVKGNIENGGGQATKSYFKHHDAGQKAVTGWSDVKVNSLADCATPARQLTRRLRGSLEGE